MDSRSDARTAAASSDARLRDRILLVVRSLRPSDSAALDLLVDTDKRFAERHEPGPSATEGVEARGKGPRGSGAS